MNKIVGYAQIELDSRTHDPKVLFSSIAKNCITAMFRKPCS